jgi:hypothetical protein
VLLIHQGLGSSDIAYPRKTVVFSLVDYLRLVHLARQPFPSVQTNLNQKWKPSLQAQVQKAQLFMHPVKVQMNTFPPLESKFELSGGTVATQKPRAARLDATKDGDQPRVHLAALLDLARLILLAGAARAKIDHRPMMLSCQLYRRVTHTTGQQSGKGFEILPQNSRLPEVLFHHGLIIQTSKRPLQSQPVPAVQYPYDVGFVTFHKCRRNQVPRCIVYRSHQHHLHQEIDSVILVAALPLWVLRGETCFFVWLRLLPR